MLERLPKPIQGLLTSARGKAFGLFFMTSLASRAVGIACQLLQVPIALSVLGAEAFGLWMTLYSFTYLMNFADCGVGIGVQNKIAEAFSIDDRDTARLLFNSAFVFLLAVSSVLALILIPATFALNATSMFGLTEASVIAQAPLAMAIMAGSFAFNLPLGLAQRLAYGQQKGWMHNASQALGNLVGLGALYVAARMHAPLGLIILTTTLPNLLANGVLLVALMKPLRWLSARGFSFRLDVLKGLLGLGALFSIQQILGTVVFALPAIVISGSLGAAAVTPYNLCQRLFNLFAVIQNAFMLPLWPAYSEAKVRGEFGWIRKTLQRSVAATLGLSIFPMALGALFAPWILHLWVGGASPDTLPSLSLVWLLFAWNALIFLQQPFGYLLAGVSEVRRLTVYSIVNAAVAIPLMYWLVGSMRAHGVVLALLLAYLPFNMLGSVLETFRFLRAHPARDRDSGNDEPQIVPA